jgi:hypothetical protein
MATQRGTYKWHIYCTTFKSTVMTMQIDNLYHLHLTRNQVVWCMLWNPKWEKGRWEYPFLFLDWGFILFYAPVWTTWEWQCLQPVIREAIGSLPIKIDPFRVISQTALGPSPPKKSFIVPIKFSPLNMRNAHNPIPRIYNYSAKRDLQQHANQIERKPNLRAQSLDPGRANHEHPTRVGNDN